MRRVVSALLVPLALAGCHALEAEGFAIEVPAEHRGQVLEAVAAACRRRELVEASPQAAGWWPASVIQAHAEPGPVDTFSLCLWVEQVADGGLVVALTQFHVGWNDSPTFNALRTEVVAGLAGLGWPVRALGDEVWNLLPESGPSPVQRPPRNDPKYGGRGDAGRGP